MPRLKSRATTPALEGAWCNKLAFLTMLGRRGPFRAWGPSTTINVRPAAASSLPPVLSRTSVSRVKPAWQIPGLSIGPLVEDEALLRIIEYPHPTLRRVSKPLRRVDADLVSMVRQMFDLMYEKKGIGLAANQVDLPYRLFVMNLESDPQAKDLEHVFINPVLSQRKGSAEAEEGCLSIPGVYADVKRPEKVTIQAFDLSGQPIAAELSGLAARCVQHEVDHLDGTLFIDKLTPTARMALGEALEEFEMQFAGRRQRGEIPDDAAVAARWDELERLRC